MASAVRKAFEAEVKSGDWEKAVGHLNGLAMFEMLPALAGLSPATRKTVADKAEEILDKKWGWHGAWERVKFALDVVNTHLLPDVRPVGLPADQVEDAKRFLKQVASIVPITRTVFGFEGAGHLNPINLRATNVTVPPLFMHPKLAAVPKDKFTTTGAAAARMGVFACSKGGQTRSVVVLVPASGKPDRVLIGVTHSFGQQSAYYGKLKYTDPQSVPLIKDVAARFVFDIFGPQMVGSKKNMALILIVRAVPKGSKSELGPFAADGDFTRQVIHTIAGQTGAFSASAVEFFTYSNGISDLNWMLGACAKTLPIRAVYTIDPVGGTPALALAGCVRKQFLSGQTTHGLSKPGFEFLPLPRWEGESDYAKHNWKDPKVLQHDRHKYLHMQVMPRYCLHLGIQLS